MAQFEQLHQRVGSQQNAGRDINNYLYAARETWKPPVMLPPCAQSFVGREQDLAWLLEHLQDEVSKTLTLCGPGGMGKTALAAQALTRLVEQPEWLTSYPGGLFYHSFYGSASLETAFEEIARAYQEEPGANPRRAALRALSRRTLLVFDGVEVLSDALPLRELGGRNMVLLLSRRQSDAPDLTHRRDLDLLSQEQGVALLQELAGPRAADKQAVKRLVEQIGGYPLALQLIGSYLHSRQEEVTDYLKWFERAGVASMHHGEHQAQSVEILLQRSYDSLSPIEQEVFALLGLLAPVPFPLELMQGILRRPEQEVRQALGSLVNLSILRRPEQGYEVSHPLIHTFATSYLSWQGDTIDARSSRRQRTWQERLLLRLGGPYMTYFQKQSMWQKRVLVTLTRHFEQSDGYERDLGLWLPHVLPLLSATAQTTRRRLRAAHLFCESGFDACKQALYTQAEPLYKRALEIREQVLEPVHLSTASILNNLAALYDAQGRYKEAEPLYKRALEIHEQELGPTHPNTALSLNNLAYAYSEQGKYKDAEPLVKRALAIYEQESGPMHPDTAVALTSLGSLYVDQGKYGEAEPLFERVLVIWKEKLGETHPHTASALGNLGTLYRDLGKDEEAEPLYKRALEIREQVLGPMHPDTANSLSNLGTLYNELGRNEEVEPLYKRALEIHEKMLGPMHPDTAGSLNNLAALYKRQEKYKEAESLYKRALEIREKMLGPMHPDTAQSLNNLGAFYDAQKKYKEAERLYKRALEIREQVLGPMHPDMASSLNNLATLYYDQKKYRQAEPLYKRALEISEQALGPQHPDTQHIRRNYDVLRKEMQRRQNRAF